jgi:hypothetical protein
METKILKEAQKRVKNKIFEEAVQRKVEQLKSKKWWHKLLPYRILIIRRD